MRDLSRKGRTIVIITHAMDNLDKCDKVAFLGRGGRLCYYGNSAGAVRWVNRRSYSRIFAALGEEETSERFAAKYRSTEEYKALFREFSELYGKNSILPPEEYSEEKAWEKPPKNLKETRKKDMPQEEER